MNPYTSHGHLIEGLPTDGYDDPKTKARCGGPIICDKCAKESTQALLALDNNEYSPPDYSDTKLQVQVAVKHALGNHFYPYQITVYVNDSSEIDQKVRWVADGVSDDYTYHIISIDED